jgi:hypothetical protein
MARALTLLCLVVMDSAAPNSFENLIKNFGSFTFALASKNWLGKTMGVPKTA